MKEQTQNKDPVFGPKKCRVILRLPWYGSPSQYVEKAVRFIVSSCYFAVDVLCVFVTSRIFGGNKDVLPTHTLSNIIYNFKCRNCSSRYIGWTSARLQDRIRQHVPRGSLTEEAKKVRPRQGRPRTKAETTDETLTDQARTEQQQQQSQPGISIQRGRGRPKKSTSISPPVAMRCSDQLQSRLPPSTRPPEKTVSKSQQQESAIHRHLLSHEDCRCMYRDSDFTVICRASNVKQLKVLEAVYIGIYKPDLCVKKSHVVSLSLVNTLLC